MMTPLLLAAVSAACGGPVDEPALRDLIAEAGVYSPERAILGDEAEVALGRLLFFDPVLSGNRNIACATCHLPGFHAVDGQPLGRGEGGTGTGPSRVGGPTLPRRVIAPFNRSFVTAFLWDGRVEQLPDGTLRAPVPLPPDVDDPMVAQALLPLLDRDEMRGQPGENDLADLPDGDPFPIWAAIVERLLAFPDYVVLFERAYPGQTPSIGLVARAMVAFERQIWDVTDTAFDAFLRSRSSEPGRPIDGFAPVLEFGPDEMEGAALFFGEAGCSDCHSGPLLSDMEYHNLGVPQLGPGKDASGLDEGRYLVTGDPADRFAFRTPPLRNVDLTHPYMHDGAFDTLEEVIRHHAAPEASLRQYERRAGYPYEVHRDPETLDAILASLDPLVATPRPLDEHEVRMLATFLRSLSSQTELSLPLEAAIPATLPSGLSPPWPF